MADRLRFQRIDETNIADHPYLEIDDPCVFLREYTSGKDYSFGETNSHINNLKKKQGDGGFQYKAVAIRIWAREILHGGLDLEWFKTGTLVPIPPSKVKADPLHDNRVLRVCQEFPRLAAVPMDIRELIVQRASTVPAHLAPIRPRVADLRANYEIDEALTVPPPSQILLLDDVLTAGTHFKAAQALLRERFPGVTIYGMFWARRVFPNPFEVFD